jgi:hypothetical protein
MDLGGNSDEEYVPSEYIPSRIGNNNLRMIEPQQHHNGPFGDNSQALPFYPSLHQSSHHAKPVPKDEDWRVGAGPRSVVIPPRNLHSNNYQPEAEAISLNASHSVHSNMARKFSRGNSNQARPSHQGARGRDNYSRY